MIGPFPELLFLPGKECKKRVKELSEGLRSFQYSFDGMTFYAPAHHISQFYDYIYLNALLEPENQDVTEQLLQEGYSAFSDLATKSPNCQARSAAIFVGLVNAGLIDEVKNMVSYLRLFRTHPDGKPIGPASYQNVNFRNIVLLNDAEFPDRGKVDLFSPVIPCTVHKEAVEAYYNANCHMLTNRKEPDNYLDLRKE